MDTRPPELARFEEALATLQHRFPCLAVEVTRSHSAVDAALDFPAQPGLSFPVSINLQNCDELHICASNLWVQWFPCGEQAVFDRFVSAALGLISGEYRLLEAFVLGKPVSSRLQRPQPDGSWETLATSSSLWAFVPWPRTYRVFQNRPGA